jgi:uncharacterized membrane protein YwzB
VISILSLCNKHCDDTSIICQLVCATISWGAYESIMHPIFVLKMDVTNNQIILYLIYN